MNFNFLTIVLLVGETVKKLMKLESLRRPFENQILTPWDMYQWADENIKNIKFFYVQQRTFIVRAINTALLLQEATKKYRKLTG